MDDSVLLKMGKNLECMEKVMNEENERDLMVETDVVERSV